MVGTATLMALCGSTPVLKCSFTVHGAAQPSNQGAMFPSYRLQLSQTEIGAPHKQLLSWRGIPLRTETPGRTSRARGSWTVAAQQEGSGAAEPPVAVAEPPVAVAEPPVAVAVAEPPVAVAEPPLAVAEPPVAVAVAEPPVAVAEPPVAVAEDFGKPRRIVLFVEPSPFSYVCGYKNRFQNFIRHLREMGDEVLVVTTHHGAPADFHGARVVPSWSFPCPFYPILPLSLALSPRIIKEVADFKPDVVHASSPGIMVFGAVIIAKLLARPLVLSYHTHVPAYIPKYTFSWLVEPMWAVIRFLHRAADLTLVVSQVLGAELQSKQAVKGLRLWRKGVDSDGFHPRFRSREMRARLSNGETEKPLIVHVGRLGAEKNLDFLRKVHDELPGMRWAFVGDGPYRAELERMFEGTDAVFTGMLSGTELSEAYASADVFVTPSESETLGFVVLEAMASGTPVVAARAGGIPDIVAADGTTGLLYTPGDLADCVGKIRSLVEDKDLSERIAMAGRKDVEKFDWRASTRSVRDDAYNAAIQFWQESRNKVSRRFPWRWGVA